MLYKSAQYGCYQGPEVSKIRIIHFTFLPLMCAKAHFRGIWQNLDPLVVYILHFKLLDQVFHFQNSCIRYILKHFASPFIT